MTDVRIMNADGSRMEPTREMIESVSRLGPKKRAMALAGGSNTPYDAADLYGSHLQNWRPYLWSPDGELNVDRDRIVSRVRDLTRNDGWAAGTVTSLLDNAIGANFRPVAKPDWRTLARVTGIKAFDAVWARDYARAVESCWRNWGESPGKWCDTTRNQTMSQMQYLGFRHYLVDGDALAIAHWLPERVGFGRADYATALQMVDPDRLSNPQLRFDSNAMRGGVEVDEWGAAAAYHIRRAHAGDWFSAAESLIWDRIPRETSWGRPIVIHHYDLDRAGQHRGGAGVLTPVIQRLKMLIKYDGTELDAAIVNAIFSAYIESPFDHEMVGSMLGGDDGGALGTYQESRLDFHQKTKVGIGGVVMPTLYPGEKIGTVNAARPTSNFADFESAVLRNVAAGAGTAYEHISRDFSKANYSSYRGAMIEVWKTMSRRRTNFGKGFSGQAFSAALEEFHEVADLPLPAGAPEYAECRGAYANAEWVGPGRGYVDPVKEAQAAVLRIEAGLSTIEIECAEQGRDWVDIAASRKAEIDEYTELELKLPSWAEVQATYDDKPQEEAGGKP